MSQPELEGSAVVLTLPPPPGLSLDEIEGVPSDALVLSFPLPDPSGHASRLTTAERAVAQGILQGLTYEEVAKRRGVSQRTVANQVAAIFAKLKVRSCLALALLMRYEPSF